MCDLNVHKWSFGGAKPHSFAYILSVAPLTPWESWFLVTETSWSEKLESYDLADDVNHDNKHQLSSSVPYDFLTRAPKWILIIYVKWRTRGNWELEYLRNSQSCICYSKRSTTRLGWFQRHFSSLQFSFRGTVPKYAFN